MSKSVLSDIRRHKSVHKDWINCFDAFSPDLTVNGILAKQEFWDKELPNRVNILHFIICLNFYYKCLLLLL